MCVRPLNSQSNNERELCTKISSTSREKQTLHYCCEPYQVPHKTVCHLFQNWCLTCPLFVVSNVTNVLRGNVTVHLLHTNSISPHWEVGEVIDTWNVWNCSGQWHDLKTSPASFVINIKLFKSVETIESVSEFLLLLSIFLYCRDQCMTHPPEISLPLCR